MQLGRPGRPSVVAPCSGTRAKRVQLSCRHKGGRVLLAVVSHTAFPVRAKPSADVRPGLWREGIDPMVSAACRSRPPFLAAVAINVAFGAGQPEAGEAHLGILRISSHQTETEWRVVGMQAQGAVGGLPVAEPLGTLPTGRAALGHPRRHDRPRGPARARRLRTPRACSNRAGGRSGPCSRSSDDTLSSCH